MAIPEVTERYERALLGWFPPQRWYGDKSRELARIAVDPLTEIDLGGHRVIVMLIACHFVNGSPSTYFVPVLSSDSDAVDDPLGLLDPFGNPVFLEWLYSGFTEARTIDVRGGRTLSWIGGAAPVPPTTPSRDGRLLGGEQSNTSVRFGDEAILKIFRRVQPGINPDPELLRFLGSHTDYAHAPADLGTIELESATTSEPIVIGAMQSFVPNSGDAWIWLLQELRSPEEVTFSRLLSQIGLLGQRTADLHVALATATRNPAFTVEYVDAQYRERLRRRVRMELRSTFEALGDQYLRGEEQLAGLGRQLASLLDNVQALDDLALTRVHGDFHLGQVLKTVDDFTIIDFEGEPSRPFPERREKASPLKDVAGMLRSLDYAIASVSRETADPDRRVGLARFGSRVREAYVDSYLATMSRRDSTLVPIDDGRFAAALAIYLIEKTLYEVRYELDNRPGWIEIPLQALETLADA